MCTTCEGSGWVTAVVGNLAVMDVAEGEALRHDLFRNVWEKECPDCNGSGQREVWS